jgi:hypothetical protein
MPGRTVAHVSEPTRHRGASMIRQCAVMLTALLGVAYLPASNPDLPAWNGPVPYLTDAHISLIYWGTAWRQPTTQPSQADLTAALRDIVNGPWGSQLRQYHDIGPSRIDQVVTYASSDPTARFTDRDMRTFLDARIDRNQVVPPARHTQRIYIVLLPTGIVASDPSKTGEHLNYVRKNSAPVYLAWVLNDGTLTSANSIPKMFSHELAETLTDADISTGRHGITINQEHDEIADVCNYLYNTVNGHAEQAYWSIAANRCVLPTASPSPAQPPQQPQQPQPAGDLLQLDDASTAAQTGDRLSHQRHGRALIRPGERDSPRPWGTETLADVTDDYAMRFQPPPIRWIRSPPRCATPRRASLKIICP